MAQPPASDLSALDSRAREIFREIVEAYLTTGDPVGSRTLSRLGGVGLSAASIRKPNLFTFFAMYAPACPVSTSLPRGDMPPPPRTTSMT